MKTPAKITRRHFLQEVLVSGAAVTVIPSQVLGDSDQIAAYNRIAKVDDQTQIAAVKGVVARIRIKIGQSGTEY
jgi:hypothetical protein